MTFRPFRTSAFFIGAFLLIALWMTFHYDVTGVIADPYSRGWVDASIVMVVLTGLVTSLTKLCDDGGESDVVKIVSKFLDDKKN